MNTHYLVSITIGPVQSLIGAARRTRDLWCGSWLLAEVAKAAALSLHQQQNNCLIFPYFEKPSQALLPNNHPQDNDANIANVLRAELSFNTEQELTAVLEKAKLAALQRMSDLANEAKNLIQNKLPLHENLWQLQLNDILEVSYAWVANSQNNYAQSSIKISKAIAARKATRNFLPAATSANGEGFGIPKSSLDGARESVINLKHSDREKGRYQSILRRIGLADKEELDVLGLTKRLAGDAEQFTAYSRIAADAWLETLSSDELFQLNEAYEGLVVLDLATRVQGNKAAYANFPYDGQLLFESRLSNLMASKGLVDEDLFALKKLHAVLHSIAKHKGHPIPYAVILQADGDRMGVLLSKATTSQQSRDVSKALHGFASQVRSLVRSVRGHAIYSGGDDVLALVPLNRAIECANLLANEFVKAMSLVSAQLGVEPKDRPSLSVGIAVGHILQPLGRLRQRASHAEKLAKSSDIQSPQNDLWPLQTTRNALGITVGVRSGSELDWRCNWAEQASDISQYQATNCVGFQYLTIWNDAYTNKEISSKFGYEIREVGKRLPKQIFENKNLHKGVQISELNRQLALARTSKGEKFSDSIKKALVTRANEMGLEALGNELVVARWLSAKTASDLGGLE